MEDSFAAYFALALDDALTERRARIVSLRYGLEDGVPRTLAAVGQEMGVSRERIRQLLDKSLRIIRGKGRRQILREQTTAPCAQLILYVWEAVRPGEPGDGERLFAFAQDEWSDLPLATHIKPLILCLLGQEHAALARDFSARLRAQVAAVRREAREQQAQEKFRRLLATTILWPPACRPQALPLVMERQREVNPDGDGQVGEFESAKLGRRVQYESLLELSFYLRLEQAADVVFYQEQPFRIAYTIGDTPHVYIPDVFFVLADGRGVVAEIKPRYQMVLQANLRKWPVLREFCRRQGFGRLITDGRVGIQALWEHPVPSAFEAALLQAVAARPLNWAGYHHLRLAHQAAWLDLVAVILRHHLRWTLHPFRVQAGITRSS